MTLFNEADRRSTSIGVSRFAWTLMPARLRAVKGRSTFRKRILRESGRPGWIDRFEVGIRPSRQLDLVLLEILALLLFWFGDCSGSGVTSNSWFSCLKCTRYLLWRHLSRALLINPYISKHSDRSIPSPLPVFILSQCNDISSCTLQMNIPITQ